jgi:hypothetical protein
LVDVHAAQRHLAALRVDQQRRAVVGDVEARQRGTRSRDGGREQRDDGEEHNAHEPP